MSALILCVVGLVFIRHTSLADSAPTQNVTRSYNFSPIPVSTKLIARTKVPLFMNSRGSYTVTKILEDTNTTSSDIVLSSSPVTLVTFAPFTKNHNHSALSRTTAASKVSKINKIAKALKASPMILVSTLSSTTAQPTTSQVTNKPSTTTTTKAPTSLRDTTGKKNKLSMTKLAIMAATLSDTTTVKTSTDPTSKPTTRPTKPKKDKTKNPKSKHAKHHSTTPKPKNSKYSKKKSVRKAKSKTPRKQTKNNKRKNKNAKNKNGKRHARTYRQTDDFSGCHPYWNPKPSCGNPTTPNPSYIPKRIVKRRVRSQKGNLALHALNTLKRVNTYFKMF